MEAINIEYKGYLITTDKSLLQPVAIHKWLSEEAYWCKRVPFDTVKKAFDNSFCIGILKEGEQVGYARLITDYAVFAHLADVYIKEEHRRKGLSKKMMEIVMNLDWVKTLRKVSLATRDAHALYEQFGFKLPAHPERMMECSNPTVW